MSAAVAMVSDPGLDRIGKYPVIKEIGSGPDGSVWLADDRFAAREVAIKVFDPLAMAHPDAERRFRRALMKEASRVGRLSHPHIVSLYDAVADDDICYVVMEYVAGGNLEPHCDPANLLPLEQALEIAFKCALALEHAHRLGVIHGNLKAANVLMRRGTDIKISDFLLGAWRALCRGQSAAWGLLGVRCARAAPERRGDATDRHLRARHHPLSSSDRAPALSWAYRCGACAPDRGGLAGGAEQVSPDLPSSVEDVVLRALQRDRQERYSTWSEFSADLVEAYRTLGHQAEAPSDTDRFDTLRSLSFFRDFRDVEIWETLRIARFRQFPAGRAIIREGDRGECFYVLTSGDVEVTRCETSLDVLTPGDCFGEMLYFSQSSARRTTTITSIAPVTVLEVDSMALRLASAPCRCSSTSRSCAS